jgi:mannose-1-phosphate guanylyltransferase / phosphomannomutase
MGISAVVLAGTHHWSGSTFESLSPRPLVPVALAPLISYSLRWLQRGGVRFATICANGTTRLIDNAIGNGDDLEMKLSYYEDGTPRGAAGCVRDAGLLAGSETLVVTDGTAIPTVDLVELVTSHRDSGAGVTVVVHRDGSPSARPTPAGVYVFDRRVLEHVPETGFQDIKENLIPRLHRGGERVVAYETLAFCPHVFNAQTYLEVNQWVLERLSGEAEGAGAPLVHPSATVEPGARLVGPVQLGAGARVLAGATIVGPTSIGEESTVGRDAVVARSVLWSRCTIGEASVVHGCVVGNDAEVPPATTLLNVVRSQRTAPPPMHVFPRGQFPGAWPRAHSAAPMA